MNSNVTDSVRDDGGSTDRFLQAFFASEMPQPWPAAPEVRASASLRPRPSPASLVGSRVALAASVLVLVGCCLALSSSDSATIDRPTARPDITGGNAKLPMELRVPAPVPVLMPK